MKKESAMRLAAAAVLALLAPGCAFGQTYALDTLSVTSFGAVGDGIADDTAAINAALALSGARVLLPCGTYKISGDGLIFSADGVSLVGRGDCSIIMPSGMNNAAQVIDLNKRNNAAVRSLRIDNSLISDALHFGTVIFAGDITTGTQSGAVIDRVSIVHNQLLALGIGSRGGTLQDVRITNNYISQDTCVTAACGNAIDAGSTGARQNYVIERNRIYYPSPIVGGVGSRGPAAFSTMLPATANPYAPIDYTISGNVVRNSGSGSIEIFGGRNISVVGNTLVNPGMDATEAGYAPAGVTVTNGVSAFTPAEVDFAAANVAVIGNTIVDTQAIHTMQSGVSISNAPGYAPTATVSGNAIQGATVGRVTLNNATPATVSILDTADSADGFSAGSIAEPASGCLRRADIAFRGALGICASPAGMVAR